MHPRFRQTLLASTALMTLGVAPAVAGPDGATVVGGMATVVGSGTANVTINQNTNNAIINWNTFNIGSKETTTFNQPNTSSVVLNRVTGGLGPSEILGTLTANGHVFVINRDGVLFGPNSVVTTSGFLATTSDIKNADFMAGRYNFSIPGRPDASIVNLGHITATNGGFAALVAPGVRNSGTISAKLGTVSLAAGNSFTLDMYGDQLVNLAVGDQIAGKVIDVQTGKPLTSLVTNDGRIKANGGRVELTAAAARQVVDSVINNSGVISANTIGTHKGMIVLGAATGSTKPNGAPVQTIKLSGTLSARGRKGGGTATAGRDSAGGRGTGGGESGGTIVVSGENIQVASASINASGVGGGGTVMIGGDWGGGNPNTSLVNNASAKLASFAVPTATTVSIDGATTINASATGNGNGGKVILWSDSQTTFAGTILASGGPNGGNGGFVETSSHGVVNFSGLVDTSAPRGKTGTLLLDPTDVYINTGGTGAGTDTTGISVATILANLATNNFTVATTSNGANLGNIFVQNSINWTGNNTLTLSAHHSIELSSGVTISNTGAGSLILRADSQAQGNGYVTVSTLGQIDFSQSTGKVSIYYYPLAGYANPTYPYNYASYVTTNPGIPNQLTAYMLVNNPADLGQIFNKLDGTYALGKNIDATGFTGFASGTFFNGVLDGNGGLGTNYTISNLSLSSTQASNSYGLFPFIGANGIVRNLTLDKVNITAGADIQFIGALAGQNFGTISNVTVAGGTINGQSFSGIGAGALVGQNNGTITGSSASITVTVGDATNLNRINYAGGLVGINQGTIQSSSATGSISGGNNSVVGGLVGQNGNFGNTGGNATITNSSANAAVTSNYTAGGLVGENFISNGHDAIISNSSASGAVAVINNGFAAGGLVGQNEGTITNSSASAIVAGVNNGLAGGNDGLNSFVTVGGLVGNNQEGGTVSSSSATGLVTGQGVAMVGGLAGANNGAISSSHATGDVILIAGNGNGFSSFAGGLVGQNGNGGFPAPNATISNSYATGKVTGIASDTNSAFAVGGLVGDNSRNSTITNSQAFGAVSATVLPGSNGGVTAGGLAGNNQGTIVGSTAVSKSSNCAIGASFSCATGSVTVSSAGLGGGLVGMNNGSISNAFATGNVLGASNSVVGGLVGSQDFDGTITGTFASGNVTAGGNSFLGGLVGVSGGTVSNSSSFGSVTSIGANSIMGGLVGANAGSIVNSSSSGPVFGTSESYLGGLVGLNVGLVQDSSSTSNVTGSGAHNIAGGLVGLNFGFIDPSHSSGNVTSGANSIVGGFVGANGALKFDNGSTLIGSISPDSSGSGSASGGSGSTVGNQVGQSYPTSGIPGFPQGFCEAGLCGGSLFNPFPPAPEPQPTPQPTQQPTLTPQPQPQIIANLTAPTQLVSLTPGPVAAITPPRAPLPPGNQQTAPGTLPRIVDIPPLNETRFISDQVLVQIKCDVSIPRLEAAVRRFGLTLMASQNMCGTTGTQAVQLHIENGRHVRQVIPQLASVQIAAVIQPNYVFIAGQAPAPASAPASAGNAPEPAGTTEAPDSSQYTFEKLHLADVHRIARGTNITIAVIDSMIDASHPDLAGVIAQKYSAVGKDEPPHAHGTGMAGAIASHQRISGISPSARIFAVHAFSATATSAESATFNILKGIDWATSQGVRIINMSFAGPKDPSLERSLKIAYDKGIVLIAAAGNAGPKSPPLYPGADPYVIAVTATDIDDKLFTGANRGKYVAVAAPGVDVIVPAPGNEYQVTTGTSVASAEVAGIAALLLERNPNLKPADIRRILTSSATRMGTAPRDDNFGSGLVDPLKAIRAADPRTSAR